MLIHKYKKITFVHGWLFGPYIWDDIQNYFLSIDNHEIVSMPGYGHQTTSGKRTDIINSLLLEGEENSLIIAYSYGATSILLSEKMGECRSTILLINPFIKPKTRSVNELYENINSDFDSTIRRFIHNSVKSDNNHTLNYRKLLNLFYHNPIPSIEVLNTELKHLMTIDISKVSVCESDNIKILGLVSGVIHFLQYFIKHFLRIILLIKN